MKKNILGVFLALILTVTSIVPSFSRLVYAEENQVKYQITVEGEDVVIGITGGEISNVRKVRINGDEFGEGIGMSPYSLQGEKILIKNYRPKLFKKNDISIQSPLYGEVAQLFEYSEGMAVGDILEIEDISIKTYGEPSIALKDGIAIELYYKGEAENGAEEGKALYNLMKLVEKVKIDGLEIPMKDTDGGATFTLRDGEYRIYDIGTYGQATIASFKARDERKEGHRVEISFKGGDILVYQTEDYIPPSDPEEPSDPELPQEDENTNGLAQERTINKMEIVENYGAEGLYIYTDPSLTRANMGKMEKIIVNGKEFTMDKFSWAWTQDTVRSEESDVVAAAKSNGKNIKIKVYYKDKSILRYDGTLVMPTQPMDDQYNPSPNHIELAFGADLPEARTTVKEVDNLPISKVEWVIAPNVNKIGKQECEVKITYEDGTTDSLYPNVNVMQENEDIQIQKLNANGVPGKETSSELSLTLSKDIDLVKENLRLTGAEILKVKDNNDGSYKVEIGNINVENGESLSLEIVKKGFTFTPSPKKVIINKKISESNETIAEGRKMVSAKLGGFNNGSLQISTEPKWTRADDNKVKTVSINGISFPSQNKFFFSLSSDTYQSSDEEVIEAFKKNSANPYIVITFTDNSQLVYGQKPGPGPDQGLLEDGDYTLSFKAYTKGTEQKDSSMVESYFDPRVKLVVNQGQYTLHFLNTVSANALYDFVIKEESGYQLSERKIVKQKANGVVEFVEYVTNVKDIKGILDGEVLVTIGASENDKGNYVKYKKFDLVFGPAEKGWTNFKAIEDAEETEKNNDEILIEALINAGFDTNNDGKISPEELRNGTSDSSKPDWPEAPSHVLDLGNLGLTDIRMLKDLGDGVDSINFEGNDIKNLPENLFQHASGLKALHFAGNEIAEIAPSAFSGATNLRTLDMEGNPIASLPTGLFDNNRRLRVLSLYECNIASIPQGLLDNNSKLEELYMYGNSELSSLPDDLFKNNTRLKRVELKENNLEALPTSLSKAKYLEILTAGRNQIESIPEEYAQLKNLKLVDLENNKIKSIPLGMLESMIVSANIDTLSNSVVLNLKLNDLTSFPVEELLRAIDKTSKKQGFTELKLNLNGLKAELTPKEELDYKKIGVKFDTVKEVYYPQKTNVKPVLTAGKGKIQLNSDIDLLELWYWDEGDSSYYGGKDIFKSNQEFKTYLERGGKEYNGVDEKVERAEAAKSIVKNKLKSNWLIQTEILKNGKSIKSKKTTNELEGISQEFVDKTMEKGDVYTLVKSMYSKNIFGKSIKVAEFKVEGRAESSEEGSTNQATRYLIPAKVLRNNSSSLSMVDELIKKPVEVIEKDGKFEYRLNFKPVMGGEITSFEITTPGIKQVVKKQDSEGEYNQKYVFTLSKKVDILDVTFGVSAMGGMNPSADIVLDWSKAEIEKIDLPVDPGTDPVDPGTDPVDPGTDPVDPGTDPVDPETDPVDPGTDPVDPETDPVDPGTDPVDPGTDPVKPKTDPVKPKIKPIKPKEEKKIEEKRKEEPKKILIDSKIAEKGYIRGYEDNTFKPDKGMSRAEVASILSRVILNKTKSGNPFNDMDRSQWYFKDVSKLVDLGILEGYPDGSFKGDKPVTRAEFVSMIVKCLDIKAGDKSFMDLSSEHWANEAIKACASAGIIHGYPDGSFKADQGITRAECVLILNRAFEIKTLENVQNTAFIDLSPEHWAYKEILSVVEK